MAANQEGSQQAGGNFPVAIVAGTIAAVVCGVAWAAVTFYSGYELGLVAWLIGAVIGGVMVGAAQQQSIQLAVAAAAIILLGLLVGKMLTVQWIADSETEMIASTPDAAVFAVWSEMAEDHDFSPEAREWVDYPTGETPPQSIAAEMAAFDELAAERFQSMSEQERQQALDRLVDDPLAGMSMVDQLKMVTSGYDFLWAGLALLTGCKICAPSTEPNEA